MIRYAPRHKRVFSAATFGALIALFVLPSCGWERKGAQALDTAGDDPAMRPLPEYAPGQAILLHIEGVNSFAESPQGSAPLLNELLAMFPKVVIIDDAAADFAPKAREQIEELFIGSQLARSRLVIQRIAAGGDGGRFLRDWVGLQLTNGKRFEVMDFKYFQGGDKSADLLYDQLKLPVRRSEKFFEGGNFTADSQGNCFLGEGGASTRRPARFQGVHEELLALGCTTATYLPSMGRQGDGSHTYVNHIDLWMRLLSDDIAAVATLDPASLEAFKQSPTEFLAPILSVPPTEDIIQDTLSEFQDLQDKLDAGAKILAEQGKTVLRIPHPVPISGGLEPFLNGVQSDKRLLLSSLPPGDFNIGGLRPDIMKAIMKETLDILQRSGFEAKFFDASPLVNGSGALHCGTANLPAQLF